MSGNNSQTSSVQDLVPVSSSSASPNSSRQVVKHETKSQVTTVRQVRIVSSSSRSTGKFSHGSLLGSKRQLEGSHFPLADSNSLVSVQSTGALNETDGLFTNQNLPGSPGPSSLDSSSGPLFPSQSFTGDLTSLPSIKSGVATSSSSTITTTRTFRSQNHITTSSNLMPDKLLKDDSDFSGMLSKFSLENGSRASPQFSLTDDSPASHALVASTDPSMKIVASDNTPAPKMSFKSLTMMDPDNKTVRSGQQLQTSNESVMMGDDNSLIHSKTHTTSSVMTTFSSSNEEVVKEVFSAIKEQERIYEKALRYQSRLFANAPLYQIYSGPVDAIEYEIPCAWGSKTAFQAITEHENEDEKPSTGGVVIEELPATPPPEEGKTLCIAPPAEVGPPSPSPVPSPVPSPAPSPVTKRSSKSEKDKSKDKEKQKSKWHKHKKDKSKQSDHLSNNDSNRSSSSPEKDTNKVAEITRESPQQPIINKENTNKENTATQPKISPTPSMKPDVKSKELANRLVGQGPSRTCWSEMQEVLESNVLKTLDKKTIKLQESLFEVITSEASYYRSLSVLVNQFYKAKEFNPNSPGSVISVIEKHHLFSNILLIHLVSEQFLNDLESRWIEQRPILRDICDLVERSATKTFDPYVTYLRNQTYQRDAYQKLSQNPQFRAVLSRIQSNPDCSRLHLDTFLMLPMQRLTRLRLLIETIVKNLSDIGGPEAEESKRTAQRAIEAVKKLLTASENERSIMDQKARLIQLASLLDYGENVKRIPMTGKELVKEGEVKSVTEGKGSMLRRLNIKKSPSYYLFLFSDMLLITKKKSNRYLVLDYCNRAGLNVPSNMLAPLGSSLAGNSSQSLSSMSSIQSLNSIGSSSTIKEDILLNPAVFCLQLANSHNGTFSELYLMAENREERDKWFSLLSKNLEENMDDSSLSDDNSSGFKKSVVRN